VEDLQEWLTMLTVPFFHEYDWSNEEDASSPQVSPTVSGGFLVAVAQVSEMSERGNLEL
jgi:hypothetical protein